MSQSRELGGRAPEDAEIRVLDDSVIDQIAAGEVVERPASVVKELVENALDADATRVRVEVREGGTALVGITDNGIGMSAADAHLSLQRHATSKLTGTSDLLRISSFGFRGEALPSIASVSRMRLRTRLRGSAPDTPGYEIRLEGGRITREGEVGAPEGTRIEVADLFANVPARRKFLKKPSTEWTHIADWMTRLALVLPGIHFELQRDDKPALVWPATAEPLDRIAAVLSEREAAGLVAVEYEEPGGHVQAFVSTPEHTRPNTNGLYLFVNGRPVRDKLLRQAVLNPYRDWLPRGRFPTAVVFLTVPTEDVDVNVHPAKWEVRFVEPRAIHRLIRHSVRRAIAERSWLGSSPPAKGWGPESVREGGAAFADEAPGRIARASNQEETPDWILAPRHPERAGESVAQSPTTHGPTSEAGLRFSELRSLGQMSASYLLVEGEHGLLLIDQHAAHERVLYERMRAQWLEQAIPSQGLLLPQTITLEASSIAALREHSAAVVRLGFDVEAFGEDAVLLRAVPALLGQRDPAELVRELARELEAEGVRGELDADVTRWLPGADRIFATLACHAARRFGDHLQSEEQRGLLRELDTIPWSPTCPHGRPVAISIDLAEIERRFARR